MRSWRASLVLVAWALPALAQDAPKSILPPGFEAPPPAPRPQPEPEPAPAPDEETAPIAPSPVAPAPILTVDPLLAPPPPLPAGGATGWLTPEAGGYGNAAFAGSNGRFLTGLMRRIDAPIASRWGEIVLRRALLSVTPPPSGARFADWVGERAWLLVRLGEVDGAKALIDPIPLERYSPRLYEIAAQVHLAAGDIPALCPLGQTAETLSREPLWPLVNAMCAGLNGDDLTSAGIFDTLRSARRVDPFDLQLAERIAASANGSGRIANIDWESAGRLSTYRFGLARAAGLPIPQAAIDRAPAAVKAWTLRSAAAPLESRVAVAPTVAALGVSSASEIVSLYAAQAAELDPFALDASPAGRLRAAYVARSVADRMAALRTLWARGRTERERYGMLILTGDAAARLPIDKADIDGETAKVSAMLAAGLVDPALKRAPLAGDSPALWALLAVAEPGNGLAQRSGAFDDWKSAESKRLGEARATRRAQLLAAALTGLGKGNWSKALDRMDVPDEPNAFTRAIDSAAAAGRRGEVAVLAGTGLQRDWASVPPRHLQHILAAYRRVGLGGTARLLAAEALTRG